MSDFLPYRGKTTLTEKEEGWNPLAEEPSKSPPTYTREEFKRLEAEDFQRVKGDLPKYLSAISTRELLEALNNARCGRYRTIWVMGDFCHHSIAPSVDELKPILATREHIPNKAERKENRRREAKEKRNRR